MTTKERILFEALKLFSINGFDSVSTRSIARAVDASDAVIYKHFKNKQEIFDQIVAICTQRFIEKRNRININTIDWDGIDALCLEMFHFHTSDEWIMPFRRFLVLEQFKNPEIAKLYKEFFIDIPINSTASIFEELIKQGYMKKGDATVYAMELYCPFFMCHTLKDENGTLEKLLKAHVETFCKNVKC